MLDKSFKKALDEYINMLYTDDMVDDYPYKISVEYDSMRLAKDEIEWLKERNFEFKMNLSFTTDINQVYYFTHEQHAIMFALYYEGL